MSTNTWKNMDAGLLTMIAKVARNEALSAADEKTIADFLKNYAGSGGDSGYPGGPAGDVRGNNNLRRTNWFNGRYLTAEALSRQDVYFDYRTRLTAHALMPGIAWGLGLTADGANVTPVFTDVLAEGMPPDRQITLKRGLAFDHIGRPILVSMPFQFTIEQLLGTYRKTPQKVVGGGIEFMPCVCLVPDPAGPTGGSAALPTGPYLLIIQAGETEEGGAKVMGEICSGAASANCKADTWRGGFGLSLVRFPVDIPLTANLHTAWSLRGTLSAYFFDVFEHPLWKRWDPDFATDGPFCADTGPGRHDGAAVALAMLYLAEDGSVLFLDQWIPRRSICDTPGEDWHRTRFGAPPRAAAWARIHQFQCMLAESLAVAPLGSERSGLFDRGFRHIPPIGFLPITPRPRDGEFNTGIALIDAMLKITQGSQFLVSPMVQEAIDQAEDYFARTRVLTYSVVALHDDDILEDLSNVFDKDPIQLTRRTAAVLQDAPAPATDTAPAPTVGANYTHYEYTSKVNLYRAGAISTTGTTGLTGILGVLGNLFEALGLDDLVNRRTEIVKLVVPLQGLTRQHPLIGVIDEDALNQAPAWGVNPLLTAGKALGQFSGLNDVTQALAGLIAKIGLDMLPRHFVVYVKQRLVLLDALFYLLEVLQFLLAFFAEIRSLAANQTRALTTNELRTRYLAQPVEKRAIAEALLAQPDVQATFVKAADLSASGISVSSRNQAFVAKVAETEANLANTVSDPNERQRIAVGQVADAYAAEYPDYQFVQVLTAVQPQQSLAVVNKLAVARSSEVTRTVADDVASSGPTVFQDDNARQIYTNLRESLAERKVADYVEGSNSQLTVKEVLNLSAAEAKQTLGADTYAKFTETYQADRSAAVAGAETLAQGVPTDFAVKVETEAQSGAPVAAVIEKLQADTTVTSVERPVLEQTATLLRITGGQTNFLKLVKRT